MKHRIRFQPALVEDVIRCLFPEEYSQTWSAVQSWIGAAARHLDFYCSGSSTRGRSLPGQGTRTCAGRRSAESSPQRCADGLRQPAGLADTAAQRAVDRRRPARFEWFCRIFRGICANYFCTVFFPDLPLHFHRFREIRGRCRQRAGARSRAAFCTTNNVARLSFPPGVRDRRLDGIGGRYVLYKPDRRSVFCLVKDLCVCPDRIVPGCPFPARWSRKRFSGSARSGLSPWPALLQHSPLPGQHRCTRRFP